MIGNVINKADRQRARLVYACKFLTTHCTPTLPPRTYHFRLLELRSRIYIEYIEDVKVYAHTKFLFRPQRLFRSKGSRFTPKPLSVPITLNVSKEPTCTLTFSLRRVVFRILLMSSLTCSRAKACDESPFPRFSLDV